MHWFTLLIAIAIEVAGTTSLKMAGGAVMSIWFVGALALYGVSLGLLMISLQTVPLGTAYALWAGLGTAGIAALGILAFGEPATLVRLLFLGLIILGSAGLKLTENL